MGIGRGFVTLPPYGSSPTLDDDVGDAGFVTEAGKFRVHRQISACHRGAGARVEQSAVGETDLQG